MARRAKQQEKNISYIVACILILLLDVLDKLGYFCVVYYVCRSRWPFDFYGGGGYKIDI
jgi:hypothetical protein